MGAPALLLAWILSVAPLALAHVLNDWQPPVSFGAWGLMVWLMLAGLPSAARRADIARHAEVARRAEVDMEEDATDSRPRSLLLDVALAWPPLALAAGLDLARGVPAVEVSVRLGAGLLLVPGLLRAARCAPTGYGLAWLGLVPGLAALHVALVWAAQPGPGGPAWVEALTGTSPLVWAAGAGGWQGLLAGALLACWGAFGARPVDPVGEQAP